MKPAHLIPLAIFLIAVGIFAWRLSSPEDPHVLRSALIGKPVPTFSLPPLEGRGSQGLSTADLSKGEVTVVNGWASYCTPCRAENAVLAEGPGAITASMSGRPTACRSLGSRVRWC